MTKVIIERERKEKQQHIYNLDIASGIIKFTRKKSISILLFDSVAKKRNTFARLLLDYM